MTVQGGDLNHCFLPKLRFNAIQSRHSTDDSWLLKRDCRLWRVLAMSDKFFAKSPAENERKSEVGFGRREKLDPDEVEFALTRLEPRR
jgi:hypothetical protein